MKRFFTLLVVLTVPLLPLPAQSLPAPEHAAHSDQPAAASLTIHINATPALAYAWNPASGLPDDKDDPGYTAYKEGYRLILSEKWEAARKKLQEVLAKFKKSRYRDDAAYWSAYAQKHMDRAKAAKEYALFLEQHPRSTYIDDVVADLAEIEARATVTATSDTASEVADATPAIAPSPGVAPFAQNFRNMNFNLRRMERVMRQHSNLVRMRYTPAPVAMEEGFESQKLDRATRLKVDALVALGGLQEDPQSLSTLKDVAVDRTQPRELRSVALYSLARYQDTDLLPVFVNVAEKDSDADIRGAAIQSIANSGHDKEKTFDVLSGLYGKLTDRRADDRATILCAIASVGTDRAGEFLANVARTTENNDLAMTAIDGIGQSGEDKGRRLETLVKLYGDIPAKKTDERESILYAVAEVGTDRAIDFLGTVALGDQDYDMRGSAVYLLGSVGGEKARNVLFRVLKSK